MEKRFQWSKFTSDREEQFVIREDDWDLFVAGRDKVLTLLGKKITQEDVEKQNKQVDDFNKQQTAKPLGNGVADATAPKTCPVHPNKVLFYNANGKFGPYWSHKTDQVGANGKFIYCYGVDKGKPTPVDEYERVQAY